MSTSLDYSFKNGLYLNGSLLLNTSGVSEPLNASSLFQTFIGDITAKSLMPSKLTYFGQISGAFNPKLSASMSLFYMQGVNMLLCMPSLVYGIEDNWELMLTAQTALEYRKILDNKIFMPELLVSRDKWDIDAIYIPEMDFDFKSEADRLQKIMDEKDGVNIFLSEGAGLDAIIREMESNGESIPRDAFGHVKLDEINPGQWFAKRFSSALNAEKTLVQKSGYFARSAKSNEKDLNLIKDSAKLAVDFSLVQKSGVIGKDMDENGNLTLIDFNRIKGGKPFDHSIGWFDEILKDIGQKD